MTCRPLPSLRSLHSLSRKSTCSSDAGRCAGKGMSDPAATIERYKAAAKDEVTAGYAKEVR